MSCWVAKYGASAFVAGCLIAAMAFVSHAGVMYGIGLDTLLGLSSSVGSVLATGALAVSGLLVAAFLARATTARWLWAGAGVAVFVAVAACVSLALNGGTISGGRGLTFYLTVPSYLVLGLSVVVAVTWLFKGGRTVFQFERPRSPARPLIAGVSLQVIGFVASRILVATSSWAAGRPFAYTFSLVVLCLLAPTVLYASAVLQIPLREEQGTRDSAKRSRRAGLVAGVLLVATTWVAV